MGKAWKTAFALWRAQFGGWMRLTLMAVCVTGMAFAPLLFVFAPEMRMLALSSVVLFAGLVLPLRQRLAAVMQCALSQGTVEPLLLCGENGKKRLNGMMKTAVCLMACALPLLGLSGWLFLQYKGGQDAFSFLRTIRSLGSDTVQGVLRFVGIYLLTLAPLVVGLALCAGNRHAQSLDGKKLHGRDRAKIALCWLCSQVTLLPFILSLPLMLVRKEAALLSVALLFPALSLRALILAAYVRQVVEEKA